MTNEFECLKSIAESLAFFSLMVKVVFAVAGLGVLFILGWASDQQGK
jgi:hypothetical protein